jgi:hypothetical protein
VNGPAEEPQDCSDVLEALYLFIDGEIDSPMRR